MLETEAQHAQLTLTEQLTAMQMRGHTLIEIADSFGLTVKEVRLLLEG